MSSLEFSLVALCRDVKKAGVDEGHDREHPADGKNDIIDNHSKKGKEGATRTAGNRIIESDGLNRNRAHQEKNREQYESDG